MRKLSVALGVVALLLAGCGPEAAVWLRIGAPLQIPEQVDELRVEARWDGAEGAVAFDETYMLDASDRFPLTLSLTADQLGDSTALFVEVRGFKGVDPAPPGPGGGWAQASGTVELQRGRFAELELLMKAPP